MKSSVSLLVFVFTIGMALVPNGFAKLPISVTKSKSIPSSAFNSAKTVSRDCALQEGRFAKALSIADSALRLPYYINFNCPSVDVNRAVVVIHGTDRNADDYFNDIREMIPELTVSGNSPSQLPGETVAANNTNAGENMEPAEPILNSFSNILSPGLFLNSGKISDGQQNSVHNTPVAGQVAAGSTVIVAPRILVCETDGSPCDAEVNPEQSTYFYWSNNTGWKSGQLSASAPTNAGYGAQKSPFELLDALLLDLRDRYPNLKYVTVVGHSAGGQFVQRYAATSHSVLSLQSLGVDVHFVVANPSSYVYLEPLRWSEGGWQIPETPGCAYDTYRYGLEGLDSTLNQYIAASGIDFIRAMYPMRKVVYLLGEDDTGFDNNLDDSCSANWQGANRRERGEIYFDFIQTHYPNHNHEIAIVPGVGHDHADMLTSPLGRMKILWW